MSDILNKLVAYKYHTDKIWTSQFDDSKITLEEYHDNMVLIHCFGHEEAKSINDNSKNKTT